MPNLDEDLSDMQRAIDKVAYYFKDFIGICMVTLLFATVLKLCGVFA